MSNINHVKKALRDQLVQLVGVQRCLFAQSSVASDPVRDVDLFVYLWSGVVVHVHLLHEPLKAGKAKRIIEHGTHNGIPTLFMVNAELLPPPGGRAESDKWFLPFPALTNDHLYAYRLQENGFVVIIPVQFRPITRLEVETGYGQPFVIQQLRHFKQTVRSSTFSGYWLLADLDGTPANGATYRRTTYNAFQPPKGTAHEMPRTGENNHLNAPIKTRLELSYDLLGVRQDANRDEVRSAFRKLAFEVHPDVSELPKSEAETRFKLLSEAYEYIKLANKW